MNIPLEELAATEAGMRELESALLSLSREVREHLGDLLLDSVEEEGAIEEEAHRRWLEMERGDVVGIDGDEVIAALRARPRGGSHLDDIERPG